MKMIHSVVICEKTPSKRPHKQSTTFNIDFNWFLTCLDFKSFKPFILLFYFLNYGKKKNL